MSLTRDNVRRMAFAAFAALVLLVVIWEAWLAPPTPVPRAFWVGLKSLPLLLIAPGLWRGDARIHVIAALLALLYFCEGIADSYHAIKTATSLDLLVAVIELAAALCLIATAPLYARLTWRRAPSSRAEKES